MRIIRINTVLGEGSTGKATYNFYKYMSSRGHEVRILYGINNHNYSDPNLIFYGSKISLRVHQLVGKTFGITGVLSNGPTNRVIKEIEKFKPDVIWMGALHGYHINPYRLFEYLKNKNIWVICAMPDDFPFTGSCYCVMDCEKYKVECKNCGRFKETKSSFFIDNSNFLFRKKERAYKGFNKIVFLSAPYVIEKARQSALLKDKYLYENDSCVDISGTFYPRNVEKLRSVLKIPAGNKIIFSCAPMAKMKGGEFFFEAAQLLQNEKNITFIHAGAQINDRELPGNYINVGFISDQNLLAEYYSLADVYVCPSTGDGQPNSCLEALGCGTPILGFDTSGVPYTADKEHGTFIKEISSSALAGAIKNFPKKTPASILSCHEYGKARYSIESSMLNQERLMLSLLSDN